MDVTEREHSHRLRRRGAVILGLFAMAWAMVGVSGLGSGVILARVGAFVVTVLAVGAAFLPVPPDRERVRSQPTEWYRHVGLVNLTQFIVIVVVVVVCGSTGLVVLIPPVVCLVVGVHFFPLATSFDQPEYRPLGWALCLFSVVGLVLLIGIGPKSLFLATGFGAATSMWAVSFWLSLACIPQETK